VHPTALRLLPLCLAISGAVQAQQDAKPDWLLCANPQSLPMFRELAAEAAPREQAPTDIAADGMDVLKSDRTIFGGNVELNHADQWLGTDKLTFFHESEQYVTEGQVRYQDRVLRLTASEARGDGKAGSLSLKDVSYQFHEDLGNGVAATALMTGAIGELTDATYSTCPPGQRQWEFSAGSITINDETKRGRATNASLKLGKVPVLWFPVISFPTDDQRASGLLAPTIGQDDRNGFDLTVPVYLNLAPNYDATIAPHWMARRGLMLEGEFRYLFERQNGEVSATWLRNDDISGRDRSLVQWKHLAGLDANWFAKADLNHVSDPNYYGDFGSSIEATSTSLLASEMGLYGRGRHWTLSLSTASWQVANPLLPPGSEPYRRLPRLQASWEKSLQPWLEFGIRAEAVNFDHETQVGGQRFDIQPSLRLPLSGASWFVTPSLGFRHTSYSLDRDPFAPTADRSLQRNVGIFSLDAGAWFERSVSGGSLTQTLEPRLFYLRVPYRDQNALPLFDTQPLSFLWPSLFRDNRYGGADRQSDANQLTLALTSRLLDAADGSERLSAGIGRISYFDAPRVRIPGEPAISNDGSAWIIEANLALSDNWSIGASQQWDPDTERTELSSVRSQVRFGNGGVFNAAYRYRRDFAEQTDLSFVVPVNANWRLVGRWNYSLRDDQTLEALAGLEWKGCCTAVRLLARQYVRNFTSQENFGLYLEIELNGLGSFGRRTDHILDNAILGYSR
jgi:LPS-assembly protein